MEYIIFYRLYARHHGSIYYLDRQDPLEQQDPVFNDAYQRALDHVSQGNSSETLTEIDQRNLPWTSIQSTLRLAVGYSLPSVISPISPD